MKQVTENRTGSCVYCLSEVPLAELTEDHVIARSWFPANTPPVAKWKVPACSGCNNRFSAIEQDVLLRLALCLDPEDPAVSGIVEKARRARDPKQFKSSRDWAHRFNRREALRRDIINIRNPQALGVLPFFRDNFAKGSTTGIRIPAKSLLEIVEKWIRGVHFCEFGKLVSSGCEISVQFVEDEVAESAFAEIMQYAIRVNKGQGVEVLIWKVEENDELIAQYAFNIWNQFRAYGAIEKLETVICQ
jgi:hypothetical protein